MIDASPLGPVLDKTVGEVLAGHGLPALPTLPPPSAPLPGLPPLPQIDLDILVKPLIDLLGGFGTGDLTAGDLDPSALLRSLSKVLETTMSMSSGAVGALDELWTGTASAAAVGKSAMATGDTARVTAQGSGMSFDIQVAAGIVGSGLAAVQGIIAATIGKIAATIPIITTPLGQGAAVGFATEGLAEATAQVAVTRAQLMGPTASMTRNGVPVPITGAPAPGAVVQSALAMAGAVLDMASPAVSSTATVRPAASPTSSAGSTAGGCTRTPAAQESTVSTADDPCGFGAAGGVGGTGHVGDGGIGTVGAAAAPLAPRPFTGPASGMTEPTGHHTQPTTRATVASTGPVSASPAPLGATGTPRAAGASNEHRQSPDYLVTGVNGERMVGVIPDVSPAVLGDEKEPECMPSPDIELRLGPQTDRPVVES
ncbi:hypothetical protein [Gordonia sp. SID5947]|uniref:hypothetical protein n=1 Tax=Gordonia sp. SID5947 TaxID=2690315 RepID=UPI001F271FE4|nr:hypothetical protein [Gordonia sp. SID5947]